MKKIIKDSHDMIYYISMLSTTGGKLKVSPKKFKKLYEIKKIDKLKNVVIGFGITEKTISSLKKADGLVVGSELCKKISEFKKKDKNPVTNVVKIVRKLKNKNIMNWIKRVLNIGEKIKKFLKKRPTKEDSRK